MKSSPDAAQVVVVGGGVGGLAAACLLAREGAAVTLLERGPTVGGKMRQIEVDGRPIDSGPTVLTMRWVFDALFERCGARFDERVPVARAEVLARHAWADGARLDLFADRARSADAIGDFAGRKAARDYLAFCDAARKTYEFVEDSFINSQRPTVTGLLAHHGVRLFGGLRHVDGWRSMWSALGKHFGDPRLRQLFARYATYTGSSPFDAPATLNLIAHVEQEGVWLPREGMIAVARGMRALLEELGGQVRCGAEVERLEVTGGRVAAVHVAGGERLAADAVVFNGVPGALADGLLGGAAAPAGERPPQRSLSAITWSMVAPTAGFPLTRHGVFFSDDYPAEFDALFGRRRIPARPTIYVCAQDRGEGLPPVPDGAPERLFVLVCAPAIDGRGPLTPEEIETCETATFDWLRRCGLQVRPTAERTVRTLPRDFARLFPGSAGALYGPPSHGWRAGLQRAGATTSIPGLYLAGGGVHPGAGVPMATLSGCRAAEQVWQDLASTSRSSRVATPGGTSTSSIRTAATG